MTERLRSAIAQRDDASIGLEIPAIGKSTGAARRDLSTQSTRLSSAVGDEFIFLLAERMIVAQNVPPLHGLFNRNHSIPRRQILITDISCREQESIVIGEGIVVTVLEVGHAHVCLAINSPTEGYREATLCLSGASEADRVLELMGTAH